MKRRWFVRWRANFFTGLAVLLPSFVTIGVALWLFGTVSNITDTLLFFLPRSITHKDGGGGPMLWYWSLAALLVAVLLISSVGGLTRNYLGRRILESIDSLLLSIPLLNKIYGTIKQVNEAFSANKKSAFRQVVLVEFPRVGQYSMGFLTGEQHQEVQAKLQEKVVSVFVPTTPNPTSGFLILTPEESLIKLDMSVADGIKFIISLGSVAPDYAAPSAASARSALPVA